MIKIYINSIIVNNRNNALCYLSADKELNNGWIKKYKLSCYTLPSGVETGYRTKNIDGEKIVLNASNSRPSYSLSKKDSANIKSIAKRRFK